MMMIKKLNFKTLMKSTLLGIAASSLFFTACDPEDEMTPEMPTGSISVSDQTLDGNTIIVDNITLNQSGWVVVHASNEAGDGPQVPEIISEPLLVEEGMSNDVEVTLTNPEDINDGDKVWVMLHTDDGEAGVYEFDGANGLDGPILNDDGSIVVSPLTLSIEMPTGMITVSDQTISQNMVKIENVNLDQNGWIVVHASNEAGDGPQVPEIISQPLLVEAGEQSDLMVELTDVAGLSDGDQLWVMLHTDNGEAGAYEFDGANGFDGPILDAEGNIVMSPIVVSAASVTASNQVVNENNVIIDEVNAAVDGWIVIHADNEGAPGAVLGQSFVEAGINENVSIDLGDAVFAGGEVLFPMLHIESPADGEYGFPDNGDGPEVFGEDVVVVSMETIAPSGSITVEDQVVDANTISVGDLTVDATSWVVVHASNEAGDGPQVPEIISTPVQLEAGSNSNVQITLTEPVNGGDVLYVMIHTDNGTIGEYEFDGQNGFDGPVTTESFTVTPPQANIFVAAEQPVDANTITADEISVNATSWVVVHAGDGNGNPVVPGIISTPVQIEPGTNQDVVLELTEDVAVGDNLFVMVHTDNGVIGEYEFDGTNGLDGPVNTVMTTVRNPSVLITVNDQIIQGNTITAEALAVDVTSWVVVHASNAAGDGPQVPEIISEPLQLLPGNNLDTEITLTEPVDPDATIYVMVHYDDGVIGEYEFDGSNGLDGPLSTQSMIAQAPTGSFTANDQTLTNGNVVVESITVGQPSWVVIHRDNGMGSFEAPGIISVPVALQTGTSTDVEISFAEGNSG